MDAIYERCCGLDIHKRTVVACMVVPGSGRQSRKEIRTFGTMTDDLLALADRLAAEAVTHVAMESTGVCWKPLFNLLEDRFQLLLVNARDIKQVPGRKTDVKDCEWIADLLRHGLLKASFVPDRPQRALRELVRYRTTLVRERSAEVNRLQKTLEGANIKLASVASDPLGLSGREMLNALIDGSTDVASMAELARGKMRAKRGLLERALAGRMAPTSVFCLPSSCATSTRSTKALPASAARSRSACALMLMRSSAWTPSPALDSAWRRSWWPRLGLTCVAFRVRRTSLPGPAGALATRRAPVSARLAGLGKGTSGYVQR
jgi:hypothetical protein